MVRLDISLRSILTVVAIAASIVLLIKLWPVILIIATSLMLAAAVIPFVAWLVKRGVSRTAAAVVFAVLLLLAFFLIGIAVVPAVISQSRMLVDRLPELRQYVAEFLTRHQQYGLAAHVQGLQIGDIVHPSQVASTTQRAIGIITQVVTVIFLMIYIVVDAHRIERFLYWVVPDRYDVHVHNLLPLLQESVGGYIRGQFITSSMIAVFTSILCFLLGVPNGLALGVLAGITDFIPVVGLLLSVIPATLAALSVSVTTAIIVGAALIAYQEFENHVLVPRIYGATLRLPTVAVFVALLIGAKLAGFIGAILSLPVAAAVRVVLEYSYDVRNGHPLDLSEVGEPFAPDEESEPEPGPGPVPERVDRRR